MSRLLAVGMLLGGCASIPEPPLPVILDETPRPDAVVIPPHIARPADAAIMAPQPPLPTLPLRIDVSPRRPRQASVIAVRIDEPPGPPLADPAVTVAGRPVRLSRHGRGWIGLAALPLDSAGIFAIEVSGSRGGVDEIERRALFVRGRTYPSSRIRIGGGGGRADPELEARIARERELIRSRLAFSDDVWHPREPFDWPRPPIRTSPFGGRRVFNGSVRSRHLGLDLRGRHGQPVYAAATGRVTLTGGFFFQGNAVYLDHGLGLVTAYFHFSSVEVEEGQFVQRGELIGRSGSTGRSTAPHLHWSAYVDGENIDPESLIGFYPIPWMASAADEREDERNH